MKFLAICGSGLGSSFMVQMNIEKILKELGIKNVDVEHADISSASSGAADVFFMAKDVADGVHLADRVVILDSIIDMNELREKVTNVCKELNLV
ncbi:PTS sugar transporter subunit IIB [Peptostreptococcus canis]|uniref:PTS sugar transporter subunit IIB n=1 Tax=Peptostreptococcus canis TaxID=1159213 RepID=A0ABR6TMQ2_9FIRM|nr:PTS sugar transporter subunit IIB [Peptostreptococcus canis]MBC2576688.1 PTS sugar transporter subunit IIB [Peptostreptococcus canis]MBP1998463.1 PTS system ascorbate-specific IIB component [Peptostreptococcus canis]